MEPQPKKRRLDATVAHHSAESPRTGTSHGHMLSTFDGNGISNTHGDLHIGRDVTINNYQPPLQRSRNRERESLLESLRFDHINERHWGIKRAFAQTCRWFLQTPQFEQWTGKGLSHDNRFLWIKGKPGAGKSTLMKFLLGSMEIRMREEESNEILISFFFHARGSDLEKSTTGLYRSLLFQLLATTPELQKALDTYTFQPGHEWALGSLRSLFEEAIRISKRPVICLIDALDECEELQVRDMVGFLNDLVDLGSLYVCFASRHYPHITVDTSLDIILEDQDEHQHDITQYLTSALRIGNDKLAQQIRSELQEKARGVFMWVVLVVEILNKEYDTGNKHRLRRRLQELPGDLHELFYDIMTRDSKHQNGFLLCIQWMLFATQPLTPKQLYYAILSGFEPQYLTDCHLADISENDIQKYILDKSKGLAEPTKSHNPTIQFIHESVRDFLLKEGGLSKIFASLGTNISGRSHEALKNCCLAYISMEGLSKLTETSLGDMPHNAAIQAFPFLEYAILRIIPHANQAECHEISQEGFLTEFPRYTWVKYWNVLQKDYSLQYTTKASLLYILAQLEASELIGAFTDRQSCFEVENESYGVPILATKNSATAYTMLELQEQRGSVRSFPPLWRQFPRAALKSPTRHFRYNRNNDLFLQLVQHGNEPTCLLYLETTEYDANGKDDGGTSTLMYAAEKGYTVLAGLLINDGANVSDANINGNTPLHRASKEGHGRMVKLLIDQGADVSAFNSLGHTPLHQASNKRRADGMFIAWDGRAGPLQDLGSGHYDVAKLLLDHGADVSAVTNDGETPLHQALKRKDAELAKLFIRRDADVSVVNSDGETPLHLASEWANIEVIKELLNRGADVSVVNSNGETTHLQ